MPPLAIGLRKSSENDSLLLIKVYSIENSVFPNIFMFDEDGGYLVPIRVPVFRQKYR